MKQRTIDFLKSKKHYFIIFAIYLAISLVMFWQVTINFFTAVVNGYGDVYQSMFNLWWVPYSIFTLHQSPYFTNLLFYPVGANLVTQTLTPLAGLLTIPIQWIGGAFTYNFLFFTSFAFSGAFMFALSNYFVKNKYAAFIAGLIYAFSPMHIAQSYGHLDWTIVEWVPLFLFLYIKTIDERKLKYAFFAAVSFVLLTFMGDIEQGIMVFFATIILTILYLVFERHKLLHKEVLANLGLFIVFALLLCLPFIIGMLPYLSSGTFAVAQQNSNIISNEEWSNNLLSFFLPSYYNGIFHSMSLSYEQAIYAVTYQGALLPIDIGERVSYIGYTVLALMLIGLYFDYKHNKLKHLAIWLILGIIFAWLSLGPYLQIGSAVTGIPTLYLLYSYVPILNIIREPGRFDLIVTICTAIIAAFGFNHIIRGKDGQMALKIVAAVSVLILIEYNGMPLSGAFASSLLTNTTIPHGYNELSTVEGNFSVLVLPALPNESHPAQFPGLATYYVTATHKALVGGYVSRESDNQSLSVSVVPLIQAASNLQEGYGLGYATPIDENTSNLTLLWLANYNTAFISVIGQAYNDTSREELLYYLSSVFGQPVYSDPHNQTYIFSTQAEVLKNAGKSLVAYTVANWTPGYYYCTAYQCNQTVASMWWGPSERSLVLFSPKDQEVSMELSGISVNTTSVDVYVGTSQAQQLKFFTSERYYAVNMTVPAGLTEITFYSPGQYPYGIENITFVPK